jgi:serine/threonine protein kinase
MLDDGTYRILRLLGKGGMGAVYLAANTKAFDRPCVVKEVIEYYDPTDPEARRKALQRFEAEARTLATLKHSGIPDVYAYFSRNGHNYLVMEYIEGPDLAQGLTRRRDGQTVQGGPQPVDDVVRYLIEISSVLTYLERQQPPVIHNDIKPANIILDKNTDRAVLVDFGTAKTRYTSPASAAPGRPGAQESSVYGTIGYAAPELYEGRSEPRSDVFALAATAYHLLTDDDPRAHPFKFPEMDAIPESLRQVLSDALALDVEQRLSAAQLRSRLRALSKSPPQSATSGEQAVKVAAPPKLDILARHVVYDPDKQDSSEIVVANKGAGELNGTLTCKQPWIQVTKEFKAAPGQSVPLPLTVDLKALEPGKTHLAEVKVAAAPAGASGPVDEVMVRVEVRVPSPLLTIAPMEIDLGRVARGKRFTPPATFRVRNIGKSRAVCHISTDAAWLVLDPTHFTCLPGETQTVELTGRIDRLPGGEAHQATLDLDVQGGYSRQVQVSLRTREIRRKIGSTLMISVALSALLGAIIWFVLSVLPLFL